MKYLVKNNVFAMGKLNKAGTVIDIDPKYEKYYKGSIEKAAAEEKKVKTNGSTRRHKAGS